MEKERLFSIGQFAAQHQINKKTLMWYDEIGLFKPAKAEYNGYRYYTYYQSAELKTERLILREMPHLLYCITREEWDAQNNYL